MVLKFALLCSGTLLLLATCTGAAVPTPNVEATVQAALARQAARISATTTASVPTATPVQTSTPAPEPGPTATLTPVPTPTLTSTATPSPTIQEVIEQAKQAVVRIITDKGVGSGFIVSQDGIVITANHVVDTATTFTVALADGRQVEGNVRGRDFAADVAVITLGEAGLATVPLGDSDSLQVGDTVIKIGF